MTNAKPFQVPDETVLHTAMVLHDIKVVLAKQKNSKTIVIRADSPNDYYWAMFDPSDENQWLDEEYGDIREMPLFATRIADDKQKALELLKDKGVVTRLKVNSTQEDPENMGWKDYFVTNSFEVDINLTKFLKYHENYINAALPALNQLLVRSGRLSADTKLLPATEPAALGKQQKNKDTDTPAKKIALHPLQPKHYSDRKGVLLLNQTTELAISIKGKTMHKNGKPYLQCKLMGLLFRNVKTIKSGIFFSTFYGVHERYIDKKMEKKIRNTVSEINKKVADVGGPNNLIFIQNKKVSVNHSYL